MDWAVSLAFHSLYCWESFLRHIPAISKSLFHEMLVFWDSLGKVTHDKICLRTVTCPTLSEFICISRTDVLGGSKLQIISLGLPQPKHLPDIIWSGRLPFPAIPMNCPWTSWGQMSGNAFLKWFLSPHSETLTLGQFSVTGWSLGALSMAKWVPAFQ